MQMHKLPGPTNKMAEKPIYYKYLGVYLLQNQRQFL